MKLVLVAVLVAIIAFVGSRVSFVRVRLPLGVENLFLTGTEFLLVGVLLGSGVFNILDDATLAGLYPFLGLGLSWIGLLFGVQWEFRRLIRIPRESFGVAMVQALVTMAVVAIPSAVLFRWLFPGEGTMAIVAALTLGAAASDTAQSSLALVSRGARPEARPLMRLLKNVSDMDGLVGVVAFGFAVCLAVPHGAGSGPLWVAVSIGLGIVGGLLLTALASYRLNPREMLLIVIGAIVFGGGLALYLSLSPLLINLIAGMVVANLGRHRARTGIRSVLMHGEHSIYILFLLLIGAGWAVDALWIVAGVPAYFVVRTLGKLVGGFVSTRAFLPDALPFRRVGWGLISHGGMAVAIVINLQQIHRSGLTDAITSIVLLGILISEFISPTLTRR
ncbi:MAG: hypothetical protein QGI83_15495, partial [Candidatus Latescibacteria bacterium]|nr:hypothetical protein [Candidatus Latescibacterota bacterium]